MKQVKTKPKKSKINGKKNERVKLNMTFEEAIDLALRTPIKKKTSAK
jgi:hypothetical protein